MNFVKESFIRSTPERVFAFHEQPEALRMLTPPWEQSRVITQANISEPGSRTVIETRLLGPIRISWIAEHTAYDPPYMFEDIQIKGPFRRWRHRHIVKPSGAGAILRDEIDYQPPAGFIGRLLAPALVEGRLKRLFEYRHRVTTDWCENNSTEERTND